MSDPDWLPSERETDAFDPESICFDPTTSSDRHRKDATAQLKHVSQRATLGPQDEREIEAVALALGNGAGPESRAVVDLGFYKVRR